MKFFVCFFFAFVLMYSANCQTNKLNAVNLSSSNPALTILKVNQFPYNRPINKTVYPGYYGYKRGLMKRNAGVLFTFLGGAFLVASTNVTADYYSKYSTTAHVKHGSKQKYYWKIYGGAFLMLTSSTFISYGGIKWHKGVKIKKEFQKYKN